MTLTSSHMLPLGTIAPDFSLMDARTEKILTLGTLKSNIATVIFFICNHCPYVKHIQTKLVETANHYINKGITFIAINSNDITAYPDDAPEKMKQVAATFAYPFPYLLDDTQAIAKAYQATCTPDFYIFNHKMACVYRGCFDESTPGNNKPVTGNHLSQALDCLLNKKPMDPEQKPSMGCNIKWKSGNDPHDREIA